MPSHIPRFHHQLVVVLNIKKNIADFDVSREFLIDNERLRELMRKVFKVYFDKVAADFQRKTKEIEGFEKEYNWYSFMRRRLDSQSMRFFLESDDWNTFLLNSVNPILTSEGIRFERIRWLIENKPKRVIIFDCTQFYPNRNLRENIEKHRILVKKYLKKGEVAVILFGPFSYDTPIDFKKLLVQHKVAFGWGDLEKCAADSAEIVSTAIDSFLPRNSHFAKIPKAHGCSVATKKSFGWKDKKDEGMENLVSLYGASLFLRDFTSMRQSLKTLINMNSEIAVETVERFFEDTNTNNEQLVTGEYLVDINDDLIALILENSQIILKDDSLMLLAKTVISSMIMVNTVSMPADFFARGIFEEASLLLRRRLMCET
jgi:hypothetical protein